MEAAAGFDAASLTPSQASEVVRACARMEASVASVKALAAARAAEGNDWKIDGYRSPAEQLAAEAGMSPTSARRVLDTGRRMAGQPEVAAAALAGRLSSEQAAAVSDGVAADPAKAPELIEKARDCSIPELNEEVSRVKAAATDQEARRRAIHARRSWRRWPDRDGALQAHLCGHLEDGAAIWRALDPIRRRLIMLRRGQTPNESLDALDYDALVALANIAAGQEQELALADLLEAGLFPQLDPSHLGGRPTEADAATPPPRTKKLAGSPTRLMIRVDLDVLLRGVPREGELCEIAGYGPVPVSVVEDLIDTENPFIIGLLTKSEQVVGTYHHGRRPNTHQQSALDFLYPTCAVAGCAAKAGLQYDHRVDFAKTRITATDLLDRLCPHHHKLKTQKNWALTPGHGKRPFVPPTDTRHPNHERSGGAGPDPPG